MHKLNYHKVVFYLPNNSLSEQISKPIECWSIKQALEIATSIVELHNTKPYGFRFQTWQTLKSQELEGFEVKPNKLCESGMVYLNFGVAQSTDTNNRKRMQDFGEDDILVSLDGDVLAGNINKCLWDKKRFH